MNVREYMKAQIALRSGPGSENSHWYQPLPNGQAECMYEIKGANDMWRPVTMRDARKHGWFPGITTIAGQEKAPQLERWKIDQALLAALTHPKVHEVTDAEQLMAMLREDSEAQAKSAREQGTRLHAAIETYFRTGDIDPEHAAHIGGVCEQLHMLTGRGERELWLTEDARCHPWGFGTRVDLHSPELQMVVDFKGKDLNALKGETADNWKPKGWPEQARQLAACMAILRYGPNGRAANLFVARNCPGLVRAYEWDAADLRQAWREFTSLLLFWCIKNKFPIRMAMSQEIREAMSA